MRNEKMFIIGAIVTIGLQRIYLSFVDGLRKRNRIDRMHSKRVTECDANRHAVVCMIDLCNFSKWCDDKESTTVMFKMFEYDCLLRQLLNRNEFRILEKIEVVGDCAMIVGWTTKLNRDHVMIVMMNFASCMLNSIDRINEIFDPSVSIRIGIHHGNASSGFLSNPRKFQVFGKTINVASRIEASAPNGTCLVSDESISDDNLSLVERGNSLYSLFPRGSFDFKGVNGQIACSQLIPI